MANLAKRYGVFDSEAAVWNDNEAWVFVGGKWRDTYTDAWKCSDSATLLSEPAFHKRFAHLPALPPVAFRRS